MVTETQRGRPKKENASKARITMYFTEDEREQIEIHAKELGISSTNFIKLSTFSYIKNIKDGNR